MTIVKRWLCLTLSVLLVWFLCSCGGENGSYPFESLLLEETAVTDYRIIVPGTCSSELYGEAEELTLYLTETVGVSATLCFDYEEYTASGETEVLLGYTNRPLSRERLATLRRDDYLCRMEENGTILLGGKTDGATRVAVERFCEEILPAATAESLMHPDAGFSYTAEYPYGRVLLNGFELHLYDLVYPDDAAEAIQAQIRRFRERIEDKTGYVLSALPEGKIGETDKRILMRELSDADGSYLAYIDPDERGLEVSGDGAFGFSVALAEMENLLLTGESEECRCDISHTRSIPYEQDIYRIGTVQDSHLSEEVTPHDLSELMAPVWEYSPDVIMYDCLSDDWRERICDSLDGAYLRECPEEGGIVFSKSTSVGSIFAENDSESGVLTTVTRIGSERYGFYLVQFSGAVGGTVELTLPQAVRGSELPVVVLIHTELSGGEIGFSEAGGLGLRALVNESYEVGGCSYCFQVFATDRSVEVSMGNRSNSGGYRDITVKRTSVYS